MTTDADPGPALLRKSARHTWRLTRAVISSPLRAAGRVGAVPSAVRAATSAGSDAGLDRQVWAVGNRALLEVRGLDGPDVDRRAAGAAVQAAVAAHDGIDRALLDPATSVLAVRYDPGRCTLAEVAEVLRAAERSIAPSAPEAQAPGHLPDGGSRREPPGPPLDPVPLVVDVVALAATAVVRAARLPVASSGAAGFVALAEHQPWLRERLVRHLGRPRAERLLAISAALANAATMNTPALLLDTAQRGYAVRAQQARRSAWAQAADLLGEPPTGAFDQQPDDERPAPLPRGPVELLATRAAPVVLAAAGGVLAGTRNADLAGRAVLAGIPRAALAAKQAFIHGLVTGLSRRGVLVVDPEALRRLDVVGSVVVESSVLHVERPLIVRATATVEDWTDESVWRVAQRLLDGDAGRGEGGRGDAGRGDAGRGDGGRKKRARPAPELLPTEDHAGAVRYDLERRVLVADGREVGEVFVGLELDPLADAVLSAVREAGLRLVLTADPSAEHLASRADEVLRDGTGDPAWLRAQVRRLQGEGQVVAVVGRDPMALRVADVGVGVVRRVGEAPWSADVLTGPGMGDVPRLIAAVPEARETSERGVRVASGASFLSGLLLAVGRRGGNGRATWPVTFAAAGAMASGLRSARGVVRRPDPVPVWHTPWHALEAEEVLARLTAPEEPAPDAVDQDAPAAEPAARLRRAVRSAGSLLANMRQELADPLTPVLATGAAASAVIGSPTDALLVAGVLIGSGVISGAQRMRADNALRELLQEQRLPARVVPRAADGGVDGGPVDGGAEDGADGQGRLVPATALRVGHVIDLQAGDVVPADARLLQAQDLEVDEATLTGESTAVDKQVGATPGAELPDRACMVFEGTTVVAGSGRAVVVAVGAATEAGRALALAGRAAGPAGIQNRLEELTRRGLPVTLLGGAAVSALALLRGSPLRTALASGVGVAVAAVPEGLPLMATVAQLGAARRLSSRGVLVRSSRTVEALGRVDTVCFDKTGTLTQGRLRLVRVAGTDGQWDPADRKARRVLRAAAQAGPNANGRPLAHATDQAVLDAARAVLGRDLDRSWRELEEVPFHSGRGFSAVIGRTPRKSRLVIKGAPEVLLPRCSFVRDDAGKRRLDRAGREHAAATVHSLAAQGLRVLAVARRNVTDVPAAMGGADDVAAITDLTLLGFIGLADTPRPRAADTVGALRTAGLRPIMITGDHPVTARAVAASLGLEDDELVTGPELAELEGPARVERVARASVFARVSPEQKLQVVEALRRADRVVAMVGDGANDAAAIRVADVGIGMAARGSTSARSAADLVLTEPDVGLLLDALVEGRAMWRRVRDGVTTLLGGNAGEILFTLLGTALAGRAPIGTRQFLVVNMFTDLLPSMALALAPTPDDPAERRALVAARPPSMGVPLLRDIGIRGAVTGLSALAAWLVGRVTGTQRRASTIALATLVGAELGQTLLLGGRNPLVLATGLGSAAVLVAIIQIPGVSQLFGCTPLDPFAWGLVLACSATATITSAVLPRVLPSADEEQESDLRPGTPTGIPQLRQAVHAVPGTSTKGGADATGDTHEDTGPEAEPRHRSGRAGPARTERRHSRGRTQQIHSVGGQDG